MPIPVAVLQQASRSLGDRILDFLGKNPNQAYNLGEIYGGIEGLSETALAVVALMSVLTKTPAPLGPIIEALTALEQAGLVQSAPHNNMTYYAIRPR